MSNTFLRGNRSTTINANRLLSPNIWSECPIEALQQHRRDGRFFFDDFHTLAPHADGADLVVEAPYPYALSSSAGVTLTKIADTDQGVAQVGGNDAAFDGSNLILGNAAGWARFGPDDNVFFEARHSQGSVTDADPGPMWFLGFVEVSAPPTSVITLVDATGVLDASEDFVGWRTLGADADAAQGIYQLGGQTLAHVGPGTTNAAGSGYEAAIAVNTFQKFGFRWTGETRLMEYFINGLQVAHYNVPADSTTFPFTNHLAMIWATKTIAIATTAFNLDWWAGAAYTR